VTTHRSSFQIAPRGRAAMVALGLIPTLHAILTLLPLALASTERFGWTVVWLTPVILYLLPVVVVRAFLAVRPLTLGQLATDDPGFLAWWFSAQWQVVFVRLPFLEELLRLVPGLYSLWLRLWGARVGSLVYWAPGVVILDRPLVRIGDRVIFGIGVRINPHVIAPFNLEDGDGRVGLHINCVTIGDDALVGGYSLLLPGSEIEASAITKPFRPVHAPARRER
jgi:hypothetical protein